MRPRPRTLGIYFKIADRYTEKDQEIRRLQLTRSCSTADPDEALAGA